MRKIWGRGRRISAPTMGVEAPEKIEEIGEKKKHRMKRMLARAKHPLIMLIMGCFIILVFIIALDYIIMPDMAVDSLLYHWQIKIVGYCFGTDTGIPRILWLPVIGILMFLGYRIIPRLTYFDGGRVRTIYYNPFRFTRDSNTETITAIGSKQKYRVDKNFVKQHWLNLFILGDVTTGETISEKKDIILLQTNQIEITKNEQKDNINRMLRDMLLDIREALESGEDRKAILNYFKKQTEQPYPYYKPPYSPPI